jgi:hypothetical protein
MPPIDDMDPVGSAGQLGEHVIPKVTQMDFGASARRDHFAGIVGQRKA